MAKYLAEQPRHIALRTARGHTPHSLPLGHAQRKNQRGADVVQASGRAQAVQRGRVDRVIERAQHTQQQRRGLLAQRLRDEVAQQRLSLRATQQREPR